MRNTLLTIAVVMFAATQASAALMVTDGSFETETSGTVVAAPGTTGGWTVSGDLDTFTSVPFSGNLAPQDGAQYIQVRTGSAGGSIISQFLGTTDAISDVTLGAYFSPRNTGAQALGTYTFGLFSDAAGTMPLDVTLTRPNGAVETNQPNGAVGTWMFDDVIAENVPAGTTVYAAFTADAFAGTTNFLFIDNVSVSVTAIPEPSSMLLVGLGVLGLGVVRRRRQS